MSKKTRLFKSKELKSRSEVSAFLRQLADKISEDQVVLRQGQEEVILHFPHDSLLLEVEAEDKDEGTKGIQHSLEVEIKWFDDEQGGGPLELG